ncbi:MAG TPA: YcgL domain-containing protein [Leucothrix mucor]|nr:YcgL domain-containing protein [Leucothrix mucor]
MPCYVYRSKKNQEMYLYLSIKDQFSDVPESLMKLIGEVEFSFDFKLDTKRKLLRYESSEVMRNLKDNGFFLQMPPNGYKSDNDGELNANLQGF